MSYVFEVKRINDNWRNAIYFDIETVDSLEQINGNLENLNVAKAKHACFGVFVENDLPELGKLGLKRIQRDDVVLYLVMNTDAETIALTLLAMLDITGLNVIVAHNGNHFDFLILKSLVKLREQRGNLFFHWQNKLIRCVDTIKIARACGTAGLDSFAKLFTGIGKLTEGDLADYLVHDVYVLMMTCKRLQELGIQFTPTRTARNAIAEHLGEAKIVTIWNGVYPFELIGGRTQIFRYVANGGHVYDFNSLYPSVMAKTPMPALEYINDIYYIRPRAVDVERFYAELDEIAPLLLKVCSGCDVNEFRLITDFFTRMYPLTWLYFVKAKVKKLRPEFEKVAKVITRYYPFAGITKHGKRHYSWIAEEVVSAVGLEVFGLAAFEFELVDLIAYPAENLKFGTMYEMMYLRRRELKKMRDLRENLLKIIMNSSYGIFGLKADAPKNASISISLDEAKELLEDMKTQKHVSIEHVEWNPLFAIAYDSVESAEIQLVENPFTREVDVTVKRPRTFAFQSVPPHAITITANARAWLWLHMIWLAGNDHEIYYCDTDSVHTNAPPEVLGKLVGEDMLELKHEKTFEKAIYVAPKTYSLVSGSEIHIKHKSVGTELEKEFVIQSVKTDFKVIVREFISEDSVPAYIPGNENWLARLNIEGLKIRECTQYMMLIEKYRNLHEERKRVDV